MAPLDKDNLCYTHFGASFSKVRFHPLNFSYGSLLLYAIEECGVFFFKVF